MGEMLIGSAIIGGGSLLAGGMNALSQKSANSANARMAQAQMNWQSEEAEKNREYQTAERNAQNMWSEDMYNKYSSPQAQIEQARQAGINPSAMLTQGASGVVNPFSGSGGSVGSGSQPSIPSVGQQQPVRFDNLLNGVGSFVRDVAEAKKLGADTSRIEKLTNEEFNNWVLKNKGQEVANAAKTIEKDILQSTKDTRVRQALTDLQNSIMDGYLKGDAYDLNQLEKRFKYLNNLLADENVGISHENKLQLAWKTKYMEQVILGDLKEQKSRTAANYAQASESRQSAKEIELRNYIEQNIMHGSYNKVTGEFIPGKIDALKMKLQRDYNLSQSEAEDAVQEWKSIIGHQGNTDQFIRWLSTRFGKIFHAGVNLHN